MLHISYPVSCPYHVTTLSGPKALLLFFSEMSCWPCLSAAPWLRVSLLSSRARCVASTAELVSLSSQQNTSTSDTWLTYNKCFRVTLPVIANINQSLFAMVASSCTVAVNDYQSKLATRNKQWISAGVRAVPIASPKYINRLSNHRSIFNIFQYISISISEVVNHPAAQLILPEKLLDRRLTSSVALSIPTELELTAACNKLRRCSGEGSLDDPILPSWVHGGCKDCKVTTKWIQDHENIMNIRPYRWDVRSNPKSSQWLSLDADLGRCLGDLEPGGSPWLCVTDA